MTKLNLILGLASLLVINIAQASKPTCDIEKIQIELKAFNSANLELSGINVEEAQLQVVINNKYKELYEVKSADYDAAIKHTNELFQLEKSKAEAEGREVNFSSWRLKSAYTKQQKEHEKYIPIKNELNSLQTIESVKNASFIHKKRLEHLSANGINNERASALNNLIETCNLGRKDISGSLLKTKIKTQEPVELCVKHLEGASWSQPENIKATAFSGADLNKQFGINDYDGREMFFVIKNKGGRISIIPLDEIFKLLPSMVYYNKDQNDVYWRYFDSTGGLCY